MPDRLETSCPVEIDRGETIQLVQGEGGRATRRLIEDRIAKHLLLNRQAVQCDAAVLGAADMGDANCNIAVTTDSFVVSPLFFPGGDIGSLAVYGTVNDLAMVGAEPRYLTLALILEEGFPVPTFDRVLQSIAVAAENCRVTIIAGDTKVVPRGAADGIFINTTGIGVRTGDQSLSADRIQPGDELIVSGPIGKHGMAVLSARDSLGFDPPPVSDCAPVHEAALRLCDRLGPNLRSLRDATRGGVAAVLHEWAEASGHTCWIDQTSIPLAPETRAVSELLGIDPLFAANEGTFIAAVDAQHRDEAIECLRECAVSRDSVCFGRVQHREVSPVLVRRGIGVDQPLDEPAGAMLPRIC